MNASSDPSPEFATVPLRWVGPLRMHYCGVTEDVEIPLATYESPLWPSVGRGARVSHDGEGMQISVVRETMTRSVLVEAPDAATAHRITTELTQRKSELDAVVATTSRFAKLVDVHTEQNARLLFVRFSYTTGDASGHNMATKASDALLGWMLETWKELTYVSVSGNFCIDKKTSAVNGILGRGKHVVAEMTIPEKRVRRYLKTSAAQVVDLQWKKNWMGTCLAGGLRSANAHFANMLLGFYLATGQDAANIVEGSQGTTYAEDRDGDLYFAVTLPNLIVGAVGNGKELPFVEDNLARLGCARTETPGEAARRLAALAAACTWCGELSLLAALTNPGELMAAHIKWERG